MSMLSTFAILFETDAKKATKETDELSDVLGGVSKSANDAAKDTDKATKAYKKNEKIANDLVKSMKKMIAGYLTLRAVQAGIFDNADNIDTIGKLSQTISENIVLMDAWGAATERNGGSAEALRGTVESLQGSLQDMAITGGGEIINTLAMIGVQATKANGEIKSAFEVLPEIADAFQGMSTERSFAFGRRLGLDQGTILTLQQSRHEVDKLVERQKALGGVTREGYEKAAIFNDQWGDTKRVFDSLWLSSNNTILPLLTQFMEGLEGLGLWIKSNQTLVEGFFIGVGAVALAAFLPAIGAALLLALPFVLIAAGVAGVSVAIAVLYEDIMAWVNGSKSAIGDLLGSFEDFKKSVLDYFDDIKDGWNSLISDIGDLNPFKDIGGAIGSKLYDIFGDDGGTAAAQGTIASYSSTSLNNGGATSNQTTQQNNFTFGDTKVDARGMSSSQARNVFGSNMTESIEMAMGQLADGVKR